MDSNDESQGRADPISGSGDLAGTTRSLRPQKLSGWLMAHRWSLLFLWLPTLLSAVYYFLLAADLYASEARFVVRTPSRVQTTSLSNLLQGAGIVKAQDDVYTVNDFIVSRDAIAALGKHVDLREIFGRSDGDYFAKYPNLLYDATAEDFYRYYKNRIQVIYDTTTGISTVTVKAFRPEDAKKLADLLIQESEALVNRLNARAHDTAVRDAEIYVERAEQRVSEAQQQTLAYRTREEMLDPTKSSAAIFDTASKLQAELSAAQTRLAELNRTSPDSPMKSGLQTRIAALEQQNRKHQSRLAGSDGSMAPKIPVYEQLLLRQDFAARQLASAMASMESAREEARRQQIYLDRVVEASQPDKAEFPKRIKSVLTVFVSCFLAYLIAKFLLAGVREHAQT